VIFYCTEFTIVSVDFHMNFIVFYSSEVAGVLVEGLLDYILTLYIFCFTFSKIDIQSV